MDDSENYFYVPDIDTHKATTIIIITITITIIMIITIGQSVPRWASRDGTGR